MNPCPQHTATTPSKIIDVRKDLTIIRRRRQCKLCGQRFTTYEKLGPANDQEKTA